MLRVCVSTSLCVRMYVCVGVRVCVSVCLCVCNCVHVYVHACVRACLCMFMCMCAYVYAAGVCEWYLCVRMNVRAPLPYPVRLDRCSPNRRPLVL